jgi:hypothetical protein
MNLINPFYTTLMLITAVFEPLWKRREIRCRTPDNNTPTVNGLQDEIWHLVSDVFLCKQKN